MSFSLPTEAPLPGDPWEQVLLVALHAHLPRQRWVEGIVRQHLATSPGVLASDGAFGHPDPDRGTVPTMPEWTYYFHGIGCCLTHTDGTLIDVDFDPVHGTTAIDPFFYGRYLESLPSPEGVDALLRREEPFTESWTADLDGLRELGLIEGAHRVRLTPRGLEAAAAIEAAMRAATSRDGWLAPGAAAIERRAHKLLGRVTECRDGAALVALGARGRDKVEAAVAWILSESTIDRLTATAVHLIESWNDDIHDPQLLLLASRCTGNQPPEPQLRGRVVQIVIARYRADTLPAKVRSQLLALMREEGEATNPETSLHLCLLAPEEGLRRLARALHHDVPYVRTEAAAGLVVLAAPESAAILSRAGTAEAKVALELLRGLEPEPGPAPVGEEIMWNGKPKRVYTMAELEAAERTTWVRSSTEALTRSFAPLLARWWSH